MNPLDINAPYDSLKFIDNLQAYNASAGTDEMLDQIREIQRSGNYYWQGLVLPRGTTLIAANETVSGTIQVPKGSFITGMTHYEESGSKGFKLKLFDKGSKASIFYFEYALARIVSSNMQVRYGVGSSNPPTDAGMNLDNPFGPNYLMSPFIINEPGVLGWEIVNLNSVEAAIQVLVQLAIPLSKRSLGQKVVNRGTVG